MEVEKNTVSSFLRDLREDAVSCNVEVRQLFQVSLVGLGIVTTIIACIPGETKFVYSSVARWMVLVCIWVVVAWWFDRGRGYLARIENRLYDHFVTTFSESGIIYLVIEHEEFPDFGVTRNPRYASPLPVKVSDTAFAGRIRRFIDTFDCCFRQIGLDAHPAGWIYELPNGVVFWAFIPFIIFCMVLYGVMPQALAAVFVAAALPVGLLLLLSYIMPRLKKSQLQRAIADVLLGDVDLAGDESTG